MKPFSIPCPGAQRRAGRKKRHRSRTTRVTFSIGVSFYPDHGKDFSSLFEKADAAMYHAKRRGKNQYYIYKEDAPQAYDS
ncbi:MAG: diguanylate cyclase [Enterocloster bolteae]